MSNECIGFVVLHYLAFDVTKNCVNSILALESNLPLQIIIVDNASSNESANELENYYAKESSVTILKNDRNYGFAKGNNRGYSFLMKNFSPKFIVVLNNDVIIGDRNFIDKIFAIYNSNKFGVLGPDIISMKSNQHQNPAHINPLTKDELVHMKRNLSLRVKFFPIYKVVSWIYSPVKRIKKALVKDNKLELWKTNTDHCILFGACYIFSPIFMKLNHDQCFCDKTFLYMEEDILYNDCMKKNIPMIYNNSLQVQHYEDVATNLSITSNREKIKYERMIQSIEILIDRIED